MHDITARTKGEDGGSLASAGTQVPGEAAISRAPASTSLSPAPFVFVALLAAEIPRKERHRDFRTATGPAPGEVNAEQVEPVLLVQQLTRAEPRDGPMLDEKQEHPLTYGKALR